MDGAETGAGAGAAAGTVEGEAAVGFSLEVLSVNLVSASFFVSFSAAIVPVLLCFSFDT